MKEGSSGRPDEGDTAASCTLPASPLLFTLQSSHEFGARIAAAMGISLAEHEERHFEDGEHKIRSLVNVRNRDVFVIDSLYSDAQQSVNDKLCRLLFFLGSIRDASAARICAVVPYLCYARKDRKTKARDPLTSRYVAAMFEAVGCDRIMTIDVHNLAAFQNAFRSARTEHLEGSMLFAHHILQHFPDTELAVVSPDEGGFKRAEQFREALSHASGQPVRLAMMQKKRSDDVLTHGDLVGDVDGKVAVMIDDMISSGRTLASAAVACRGRGAVQVVAMATHGVFSSDAEAILSSAPIDRLVVTDTIPLKNLSTPFIHKRVVVLETATFFARAIHAVHHGSSIVELNLD